jgi:hypothetical protein
VRIHDPPSARVSRSITPVLDAKTPTFWTDQSDGPVEETLYQTLGGAFFLVEETARNVWNEREQKRETKAATNVTPMSRDEAQEWIMTGEVEIIKNPFEDPPEAAAEAEPGATIYIRVPASLKREVEEAAKEAKVSGNVWRCAASKGVSKRYRSILSARGISRQFSEHTPMTADGIARLV